MATSVISQVAPALLPLSAAPSTGAGPRLPDPMESFLFEQSVVIRVGTSFTRTVHSTGGRLIASRVLSHGPLLLAASQAEAASASGVAAARVIRAAARQVAERARLDGLNGPGCSIIGAGEIARAVITLGADGRSRATVAELRAATEALGLTWVAGHPGGPSQKWVEPMLIGGAILESALEFLGAEEIVAGESRHR